MAKQNKKKKNNPLNSIKEFFVNTKKETKKVIWTDKKSLIKYSIATLVFMVFICLFFVGSDLIIALISRVKELIG